MNRRLILGILVTLALVAGALALGSYAYSAGVAQGLAQSGKLVVPNGAAPYPYYGYGPFFPGFGPWGFGFGLVRCLVPLLGFLLLFSLLRVLFWGGRPWRRGWTGHWHGEQGTPPMFEEWHRRAHGQAPAPQEPKE